MKWKILLRKLSYMRKMRRKQHVCGIAYHLIHGGISVESRYNMYLACMRVYIVLFAFWVTHTSLFCWYQKIRLQWTPVLFLSNTMSHSCKCIHSTILWDEYKHIYLSFEAKLMNYDSEGRFLKSRDRGGEEAWVKSSHKKAVTLHMKV